jgi:hypothetical protein
MSRYLAWGVVCVYVFVVEEFRKFSFKSLGKIESLFSMTLERGRRENANFKGRLA